MEIFETGPTWPSVGRRRCRLHKTSNHSGREREKKPRSVDDDLIDGVKAKVRGAADALRQGAMHKAPAEKKCSGCDYQRMCSEGAKLVEKRPTVRKR